jgi:hypothetical protein
MNAVTLKTLSLGSKPRSVRIKRPLVTQIPHISGAPKPLDFVSGQRRFSWTESNLNVVSDVSWCVIFCDGK